MKMSKYNPSTTSSEGESGSSSSADPDLALDNLEVSFSLGNVTSTFTKDGLWKHSVSGAELEPSLQRKQARLLSLKMRNEVLVRRNERLRQMYDILFQKLKEKMEDRENAERGEIGEK